MAHSVDHELCIGCGACEAACPMEAISAGPDEKRIVNADICVDCGACEGVCPTEAIKDQVVARLL